MLRFFVNMPLDLATAKDFLIFSSWPAEPRIQVVPDQTTRECQNVHLCYLYLGSSCFPSGCHYWEVGVGGTLEWAYQKGPFLVASDLGFGVVCLKRDMKSCQYGNQYCSPHKPKAAEVGIFLDCDLKAISFVSATDGFHLDTFINMSISEPLCPHFCAEIPREGENVQPMKICVTRKLQMLQFGHSRGVMWSLCKKKEHLKWNW